MGLGRTMVGRELDVSDKKLKSIRDDCALTLPEKKAAAVLDAWAEEHGRGATCLKLVEALYRRKKTRVIEILCDEVKLDATTSGPGSHVAAVSPQLPGNQQQQQGNTISKKSATLYMVLLFGLSIMTLYYNIFPELAISFS